MRLPLQCGRPSGICRAATSGHPIRDPSAAPPQTEKKKKFDVWRVKYISHITTYSFMKMAKELLSDSSSESSDNEAGGAELAAEFKVNQEFAKRFEHNKKREELLRCKQAKCDANDVNVDSFLVEEKLANPSRKRKRGDGHANASASSDADSSSSSEDEDEEAEFATEALDSEILATLNAIKTKDPRVYDASATFYTGVDENTQPTKDKKDKPMYLRDYQRENLLNGVRSDEGEEPLSYNQQQQHLKRSIVSEMHAAAAEGSDDADSDEEGGLLVRKNKAEPVASTPTVKLDVETADRDPETFLSNFMAARAWLPTDKSELHPFESDDEEDEKRAEEFEEAYNMRFEDPEKSNEKLRSHARDVAARYSVRRDERNSRQKKREEKRAAKEHAKQELKEEKARLKKLRMEEVEEKVKRIKRAAGLKASDLQPEDWARFMDDDWDDSKWEEEMQRRFGDQYYAENEGLSDEKDDSDAAADGNVEANKEKKRKLKKPKFDDDIDIKDIIPDFQSEEDAAQFSLSDPDSDSAAQAPIKASKKSSKQIKQEKQKESKRQRRIIEQLVDDQLQLDLTHALPAASLNKSSGFRYRETSPQSFGLTNRDILLADDSALNQFAGLKKLASWRDEEKKRKDQKHLGKKARLRKWRAETFGNEDGPPEVEALTAVANGMEGKVDMSDEEVGGVNIREGDGERRKQKGRRRKKMKVEVEA
ncbi:Kinetochore protein Spc24 [Neophaeococcomyces mojaviensis]|uniref:Kinetochore protein Spc24 n=1 Tax=Neophaeococcomyces mojaviensis TaxID=3383035 RepID=A0ACC3ABG1_9EURO|nr:Kinetochore protein Spc24 [Knufia sp. JES_112]